MHGRADGQTDGRLTTAIPRLAVRATHGKNGYTLLIDYTLLAIN